MPICAAIAVATADSGTRAGVESVVEAGLGMAQEIYCHLVLTWHKARFTRMHELPREIPAVSLLLELEPEELAAKMLFLLRKRREFKYHLGNLEGELWPPGPPNPDQYPREKRNEISVALSEAWGWLEAQGLIIPEPGANGQNGWRLLSRRARKMETQAEFANFKVARLLPKEMLHPRIAEGCGPLLCGVSSMALHSTP
jgi:hypothetical protein